MTQITKLSKRELEILKLIGLGLNSREVAKHLYLSNDTVRTHRKRILRKTGAKNMLTVVLLAVQSQMIHIELAA
jgi:DNA-binding NarL/FixJ family response regulator